MKDRTLNILEAAVREFIVTGEPVSSSRLYEEYDFGIKPAMIRAELESLMEEGFLEQPYHSSGRTPSDRGYEFFISRLLFEPAPPDSAYARLEESFERGAWDDFLAAAASELDMLVALDSGEGEAIYKNGLERLVSSFPWQNREEVASLIRDFEELDQRMRHAEERISKERCPAIFIGRKSPVTRNEGLSAVMGKYRFRGREVCLVAVGPKRMNYPKAARIFKKLKSIEQ